MENKKVNKLLSLVSGLGSKVEDGGLKEDDLDTLISLAENILARAEEIKPTVRQVSGPYGIYGET